jgi:hypothetical protein
MQQRKSVLPPEINLNYRMFKPVTLVEKRQMLSSHMTNVQETIWPAGLDLNLRSIELEY